MSKNLLNKSSSLIDRTAKTINARIESGFFPIGSKLPSVRNLAKELQISIETAFRAYDKLVATGNVEARRGSGFYVKRIKSNRLENTFKNEKFTQEITNWQLQTNPFKPYYNDLGSGHLPEEWLARSEIAAAMRAVNQVNPSYLSQYQEVHGYLPLRQQLSLKLEEQGIHANNDQIMLTYGAADALHLSIWSHFYQGQYIIREVPCSFIHTQRLLASGVEILDVERGPEGPDTDKLEELCIKYKPKAFLCSSILQNPTSMNIAPHIAYKILKIADAYDLTIIDDDTYGDLLPNGQSNIARLATLDQLQRVIQIGSFSKTLAPGLRVGYIAASIDRIAQIMLYKSVGAIAGSQINERIVYRMISEGKYRHHCEQLRLRLDENREELRQTLINMGLSVLPSNTGMYLWAKTPEGNNVNDIYNKLKKLNIRCAPGALFANPNHKDYANHLRFNIAAANGSPALNALKDLLLS